MMSHSIAYLALAAGDACEWKTIDGAHVCIGAGGKIQKGPSALKGDDADSFGHTVTVGRKKVSIHDVAVTSHPAHSVIKRQAETAARAADVPGPLIEHVAARTAARVVSGGGDVAKIAADEAARAKRTLGEAGKSAKQTAATAEKRPTPAATGSSTPATTAKDAYSELADMLHERYGHTGQVPVKELRNRMSGHLGGEAFDRQLVGLERSGKVRLLEGPDGSKTGPDAKVAASDQSEARRVYQSRQRPAGAPSHDVVKADVAAAVNAAAVDHPNRLVPIHEIRQKIAAKLGPAAARHDVMDQAVMDLARSGSHQIVSIADQARATSDQLGASISGENEIFFYLRPNHKGLSASAGGYRSRVMLALSDCGTGDGGFQFGNTCASGITGGELNHPRMSIARAYADRVNAHVTAAREEAMKSARAFAATAKAKYLELRAGKPEPATEADDTANYADAEAAVAHAAAGLPPGIREHLAEQVLMSSAAQSLVDDGRIGAADLGQATRDYAESVAADAPHAALASVPEAYRPWVEAHAQQVADRIDAGKKVDAAKVFRKTDGGVKSDKAARIMGLAAAGYQSRAMLTLTGGDCDWKTIHGSSVCIGAGGSIEKGPDHLVNPQAAGDIEYVPPKKSHLEGDAIYLWHGTTAKAGESISKDRIRDGQRGLNASAMVATADQFPEDTGAEHLVLIKADPKHLRVDPNDQQGETVADGLFPRRLGSSATIGQHQVVAVFDIRGAKTGYREALQSGNFAKAKKLGVKVIYSAPAKKSVGLSLALSAPLILWDRNHRLTPPKPVPLALAGFPAEVFGKPAHYLRKEAVRAGDWFHRATGKPFKITRQRIDDWVSAFQRRVAAGIRPFVPDHHTEAPRAGDNHGYVVGLKREGDSLYADVQLIGDEAVALAAKNDVSIYVVPEGWDAAGNAYGEHLHHLALTPNPNQPGLGPFVSIAASAEGAKAVDVPVAEYGPPPVPPRASAHSRAVLAMAAERCGVLVRSRAALSLAGDCDWKDHRRNSCLHWRGRDNSEGAWRRARKKRQGPADRVVPSHVG